LPKTEITRFLAQEARVEAFGEAFDQKFSQEFFMILSHGLIYLVIFQ
jgi:hypothetical protein